MMLILKNIRNSIAKRRRNSSLIADDKLIHGVVSHGYGLTVDVKPERVSGKGARLRHRLALWPLPRCVPEKKHKRYGSRKPEKEIRGQRFAATVPGTSSKTAQKCWAGI